MAPGPELAEFTFHVRDQSSSRRLDDIAYTVRSLASAGGSSDYGLRIESPSNPCAAPDERLCEAKRNGLLRNQRKSPRIAHCARHRRRRAEIVPSAMAETTFGRSTLAGRLKFFRRSRTLNALLGRASLARVSLFGTCDHHRVSYATAGRLALPAKQDKRLIHPETAVLLRVGVRKKIAQAS